MHASCNRVVMLRFRSNKLVAVTPSNATSIYRNRLRRLRSVVWIDIVWQSCRVWAGVSFFPKNVQKDFFVKIVWLPITTVVCWTISRLLFIRHSGWYDMIVQNVLHWLMHQWRSSTSGCIDELDHTVYFTLLEPFNPAHWFTCYISLCILWFVFQKPLENWQLHYVSPVSV